MSRAAALLAVLALAVAAPAAASERHPSLAELEGEVMCPTCHTTLDESNSAIAQQIKSFIRVRIAQGKTKSQIKSELVDNFGPSILAAPPKRGWDLLAWALPLGGLALGAIVLGILAWRWTRDRDRPASGGGAKLDPELERRLDAELARFDG
jgi:cytochrome c-type biogenesis protein CcmH/NrfF